MLGMREPNGRLSRRIVDRAARNDMTEKEARSVVVEARMKHTGLPEEMVTKGGGGSPDAGTVHGMLRLMNELDKKAVAGISYDQWRAAETFLQIRRGYLSSILAKTGVKGKGQHGAEDSQDYIDWCRRAADRWNQLLACIQEVSIRHRSPIMAALDVLLIRQQHLDHMVGDLRIALNAIHRTFLEGQGKRL